MNKNYTLKELADIGAMAAYMAVGGTKMSLIKDSEDQPAREAFTKAVLDAVGYEFPKDEEREAFERWIETHPMRSSNDDLLEAWRAGREELRRAINKPTYSMPNNYGAIAFLASQQVDLTTEQQKAVDACLKEELSLAEPAWVPWAGGECPLTDGVEFEFKIRNGGMSGRVKHAPMYNWGCHNTSGDIVAYRVLEG